MVDIKERAKIALRTRINNLHNFSEINELIEETVEELWQIFENDAALRSYKFRKGKASASADATLWCKGVKDNG